MVAAKQDPFQLVTPEQSRLRMFLMGPSGSGKTWTALEIATRLAAQGNGKIAFLDTEGKSCKKYARDFTFSALYLKEYRPEYYIRAIEAAVENGYDVLVIDSFTHAWNGKGGVLEIVDRAAEKMGNNKFAGWKDGRPAHNNLISTLVNADIHIIGTARSKTEWLLETGANGRTKPVKVGLAAIQDSEFEYEFDIAGLLDMEHELTISKSRCRAIPVGTEFTDMDDLGDKLNAWLSDGEIPVFEPVVFEEQTPPQPELTVIKTDTGAKIDIPNGAGPDGKRKMGTKKNEPTDTVYDRNAVYTTVRPWFSSYEHMGKAFDKFITEGQINAMTSNEEAIEIFRAKYEPKKVTMDTPPE